VRSPYPRYSPEPARRRKLRFVRAWLLYVAGVGFMVLGISVIALRPTATYLNWQDVLIGSSITAFGMVVRAAAQIDLMRLKGIVASSPNAEEDWLGWLPWYLRLKDNSDGAGMVELAADDRRDE
jgi:hypothetical protein